MKKVILKYGGYAALTELVIFVLIYIVIAIFNPSHKVQGYIGWVNLICPLIFIYFGIRYYRDKVNNGSITFMKALQIGLLMMLIPTVAFAIIETVFVIYIEPDFNANIAKHDIEEYRKVLTPEKFALKVKEMQEQVKLLNNPISNFIMIVITIASLGIIATIISSALLFKKAVQLRELS